MSSKEFLNKIRHVDMMIDCKLEQVTELRSRLTGISSPSMEEKIKSSPNHDDFLINTICKITDLENEINRDIDTLVELKSVARKYIETLDSDVEKIVLYKRYFENKTFEQISVEMKYSWRQIHRLHAEALKNFDKIYKMS